MKTRLLVLLLGLILLLFLLTMSAAPVGAQSPSPGSIIYHVVQPGEWVSLIASRYGVSTRSVVDVNHLTWPYTIYPGQVLVIIKTVPPSQQTYIVRPGDTLFRIGLRYGVNWRTIANANGIAYPYIIFVGQRMIIPGTTNQALESPEQTITNFYSWYLKEAQQGNPLASKSYRTSPYLTAGFILKVDSVPASYEPFLCRQDLPRSFTVDPAIVSAPQARAVVRTIQPDNAFTVALVLEGKYWKISDVTCEVE